MNAAADDIRLFHGPDGWEILVGKTARANDVLSLKVGRPHDFWFHAAGVPGSHVLARHPDRPERCPRAVKQLAAGLAAFFSKARAGKRVAVHWTTCKYVSKRKGLSAGKVLLGRHEAVMAEPIDPGSHPGLLPEAMAVSSLPPAHIG